MKMTLYCHGQQALFNLLASKLRSFLAILGILIGTAAIVALMSCSRLATEKALAQFKALGTDLIAVSVFQQAANTTHSGQTEIELNVWRQLPLLIPSIVKVAPYNTAYQPISFQGKPLTGAIVGADETLADILHIELAAGNFVSFVDSYEHFCVIGAGLAEKLRQLSLDALLNQQLRIGQTLYTIIGVAKPWKENGFFNEDINQAVITPIAGMALINKETRVNNAIMLLRPDTPIDTVVAQIKTTIERQAPTLSVFVRSAQQIIASMESQGRIFALLLTVIGSIALLVGGIGVMNVMLVAVSERKKEIGIRKAIGAKNHEIQALFLVESILLSLLGGVLGVVLGLLCTWIIAYFNDWPQQFYLLPSLAGFGISVITGIFFGFYPAHRAALLEPIESLRSA